MSQIFRVRNKIFVEELKRYHFSCSTSVEYKENNSSFKILLINQNKKKNTSFKNKNQKID
jgi:hypothetical protein